MDNLDKEQIVKDNLSVKAYVEKTIVARCAQLDAAIAALNKLREGFVQDVLMENNLEIIGLGGLEEATKKLVLELGYTVTGTEYQAVFSEGRVTWQTDHLDGFAEAHPEILKFRNQPKPSVSIRKRNGK